MNADRRYDHVLATVLMTAAVPTVMAAETAQTDTLEEVVVTAQKQVSTEQKTPISMQVYGAEELARRGVVDLATLAQRDPSLTFAMSTSQPYLALRGVSTGNVTETGNPSVAVATDGIFLNRSFSLNASLFDLERIEILRGPQGTLYGRNAVGGVVNIITNKPTHTFGGQASVDLGNYHTVNAQGAINLPMGDAVAVRIAGASFSRDGYRNNAPARDDGDDQGSNAARAQFLFEPSDTFSALVGFTYIDVDQTGKVGKLFPLNTANPDHGPQNVGSSDGWPVNAPLFEELSSKDVKWDFVYSGLPGGASINLLGGYNDMEWYHGLPQLPNPGGGNVPGGTSANVAYFQHEFPKTLSNELRVSSAPDARLAWQFGLYDFQEDSEVRSRFIDNFGTAFENRDITTFNFPKVDSESRAGFGQISFAATDAVKVTAGARYTKDTQEREGTFDLFLLVGPGNTIPIHVTPPVNGKAESSKTTWLVDVDWNLTDDNMLYAKASTGYKAGGFTGAGQYAPETLIAYEIGSKNRFSEDRIQFNAAAFFMDYTDQQLNQFSDPTVGAQTVNADSEIYGLEGSFAAILNDNNRFDLSFNYLNTEITAFVPPPNYNPALSASVVGNEVPLSPEFSASAGYDLSFSGLGGKWSAGVRAKYESDKFYSANNFESTHQDAFTTVDLNLGYEPDGARWSVQAYARNLTDEDVLVDASEVYVARAYVYSFAAPLTYGIRFSAFFD